MKTNRKLTVCDRVFRVGEDSTPEFAKVRDCRGAGSITSRNRMESEAYRKFLTRDKQQD